MNGGSPHSCAPSLRSDRAWLVVRTKPRQERVAVHHLQGRGVEPYCPFLLQPPSYRKAPRGPVPLFPGYIFAACDPVEELNAVQYCPGVLRPLSFDGTPATVAQSLIDELRRRESERGYIVLEDICARIEKGARVRVTEGPLEGFEGIFQGYLRGGRRVRILLNFLRSRRRVEVDVTALAPVPA